jgi:predicted DNA-binding transcriptional regulator AlpA
MRTQSVREQPSGKRLGDVRAVAAKYACDERSIFRWADQGLIPWGLKLGALRRWDLDQIDEHIADGCPSCRQQRGAK